ncbi:MAG: hypothetical protein WCC67_11705, partial [Candidatus Acidiferrales bacterium]
VPLAGIPQQHDYAQGELAAVIGREFLVPNDSERGEEELLAEAVRLSGDSRFRRKRAAYWRWQEEFLHEAIILDDKAVSEAVEEMNDLIEDEKAEVRRSRIKLGVSFVFAVGAATTGMLTGPLAPVALAGAFLSVGGWVIDHGSEAFGLGGAKDSPAGLCLSARREFGWSG